MKKVWTAQTGRQTDGRTDRKIERQTKRERERARERETERKNNEHGCVYLRCRAVCKLPGCVEGHPWNESPGCAQQFLLFHIKPLHNVCANQVHQFVICTICKIYYTKYHTIQYRNHVLNRKKDIQWNILEIFHGTSICQLFLKIKYIPILRNVPAACPMFQ